MKRYSFVFVVYTMYAIPPHFTEENLDASPLKNTCLLLEVQSKKIIRVVQTGDVQGCFSIVFISKKLDAS